MATVNGFNVLSGKVTLPLTGRWHADVKLAPKQGAAPVALTGRATIDLDGVTMLGSFYRSGPQDGAIGARIIGGNNGLQKQLLEKWYKGASTLGRIVRDIIRETGETLSAGSDAALLNTSLAAWERAAGPGGTALSQVLESQGASWRLAADGSVLVVAAETWPEVDPPHVLVPGTDQASGFYLLAPSGPPTLVPGVTFLGQRIRYVEHEVDGSKLRTRARYEQPRALLDRLRTMDQSTAFSRMWPAVVERQNPDKTIDVVVDGRFGLTQVPIRHGLPGFVVNVAQGARVLIGFEADNPRAPFASLWANGESVESVVFDGGTRPFARVGDEVQVFMAPAVPIAISGVMGIPPATTPFTGTITITNPLVGVIGSGNPKSLG